MGVPGMGPKDKACVQVQSDYVDFISFGGFQLVELKLGATCQALSR